MNLVYEVAFSCRSHEACFSSPLPSFDSSGDYKALKVNIS